MIQLKDLESGDQVRIAAAIITRQRQQAAAQAIAARLLPEIRRRLAAQSERRPALYRSYSGHMQSTEGQLRCGCPACLASLGPLARGYWRLR